MEAKFTRGPWIEMDAEPYDIKRRHGCAYVGIGREGDEPVAIAVTSDHYSNSTFEANARLIAAAPDLLEELEQQADGTATIISLLAGQDGPVAASLRGMLSIQEQAARAAIARAQAPAPGEV